VAVGRAAPNSGVTTRKGWGRIRRVPCKCKECRASASAESTHFGAMFITKDEKLGQADHFPDALLKKPQIY
jgi:hypothetical protein